MKKEGLVILLALCLLVLTAAYSAAEEKGGGKAARVSCRDTGALYISDFDAGMPKVYAKRAGAGKKFAVPGEWSKVDEFAYFESDEAIFLDSNKTAYTIYAGSRTYAVTCPAFVFSCRIINASLDSCYKKGSQFTGTFYAYNFRMSSSRSLRFEKPFMLTYEAAGEGNKKLVHGPKIVSAGFENISISVVRKEGYNKFFLRWNTTKNIVRFSAKYQECGTGRYSFYDSIECSEKPACSADSECMADESCEEGACGKLKCGECSYIESHECRQRECCSSGDCEEELYCAQNRCLKVVCLGDETVQSHACARLQCADDEYAANGTCIRLECREYEFADNNKCNELQCAGDEAARNHQCEKLACKRLEKPENHACVSSLRSFFSRLFGKS